MDSKQVGRQPDDPMYRKDEPSPRQQPPDRERVLAEGQEAKRLLESPLAKRWWDMVRDGHYSLLSADGVSQDVRGQILKLQGAYAFRVFLLGFVQRAEQVIQEDKHGRR